MEGVHRVYDNSIRYTKRQYVPSTWGSVLYILLYTAITVYITEYLLKGKITRLLYLGSVVMVVAWIYEGSVTDSDLIILK